MIVPSWLVLTPTAVVAVLLSGMAAYLGLRHPGDQLRRTSMREVSGRGGDPRVSRAFAGRREVPSLRRRLLICGVAAGALCLLAAGLSLQIGRQRTRPSIAPAPATA